jgi:hypothetical protein
MFGRGSPANAMSKSISESKGSKEFFLNQKQKKAAGVSCGQISVQ